MSTFNKHTLCYNIETNTICAISACTFFSFSESLDISRCVFKIEMHICVFLIICNYPLIPLGPHFTKSSAVITNNMLSWVYVWTASWPVHDLNILLVQKGCRRHVLYGAGHYLGRTQSYVQTPPSPMATFDSSRSGCTDAGGQRSSPNG